MTGSDAAAPTQGNSAPGNSADGKPADGKPAGAASGTAPKPGQAPNRGKRKRR